MLAGNSQNAMLDFSRALRVQLPAELQNRFFRESGYSSTTTDEKRCRARLAVRREAKINFTDLPNRYQKDDDQELRALVKDVSRGGVAILYHEQIFPEDVFRIYFNSRVVTAVAVRCRKLGINCYEVGGRILEAARWEDSGADDYNE